MDMDKVPSLVIKEICSFLSFEDVQSLMKTNRNNYCAIKSHKLDKIRLKSLRLDLRNSTFRSVFGETRADGFDLSGKKYTFANFKFTEGEEDAQLKQALDQVYSVDDLHICRKVFTMELFNYLMAAKIKIKVFSLCVDGMDISAIDLVKFCSKYHLVHIENTCETYTDPAIWSDKVFTSILPSTICKPKSRAVIGGPGSPMPITDRTLEAIFKAMPGYFSLYRVHLCITIEGIVKAIQTHLESKDAKPFYDLGCLPRNQKADAERYLQKEAGRAFYFTRFRGFPPDGVEHAYQVYHSSNNRNFFGRFSIGL